MNDSGLDESKLESDSYQDYAEHLDVPWYEKVKETMFQYFSKVQTDANPHILFGYVVFVFITMQCTFPTFVQEACNQKENILGKIIKFLSIIWCGAGMFDGMAAPIMSFIISLVIIGLIIASFFHALRYSKHRRASAIEANVSFIIFTYVFQILIPFLTSCFGQSIEYLINGKKSWILFASILLTIISFTILLIWKFFFYSPRIMFINDVTMNWSPLSSTIITLCTGLLAALSSINVSLNSNKISCFILIFVISYIQISLSVYLFVDISFINRKFGNIFSAIIFACGLGNILNLISVYYQINYTLIFFITVALIIISIPSFLFINTRIVEKALTRISFVDDENEKDVYVKANQFLRDIRLTIEFSPPQVFSWNLYEDFLKTEGDNNELILMYCRLLSSFPRYSYHLNHLILLMKYSTMILRRAYFLQLCHIISHRNTSTTSEIISFFNAYDYHYHTLEILRTRFWENVLAENRSAFWTNTIEYNKQINTINTLIKNALYDFENSPEVVSFAIKVYETTTYDFASAKKLFDDLNMLKAGVPAHSDRALKNILSVFPMIGGVSTELVQDIEILGHEISLEDVDKNLLQRKEVVNGLLHHAKVGQVWAAMVYFFIASVVLLVFVTVFIQKLNGDVVKEIQKTSDFQIQTSNLLHVITRYALFKCFNIGLYHTENSPMSNSEERMQRISPHWYPKYVSKYDPSDTKLANYEFLIRDAMAKTADTLHQIDNTREPVKVFTDRFSDEKINGLTLNELIIVFLEKDTMDMSYFETVLQLYSFVKEILEEFTLATTFNTIPLSINILMIVSLLICLLLYSFPMMLYLFMLHTQMEDIASCFLTLPVSELKKIIGEQTRRSKQDNAALSTISMLKLDLLNTPMIILLAMSIIPTFVVVFTSFFYQKSFVIDADIDCQASGYVKTPFAAMRMTFLAIALSFLESYPLETKGIERNEVQQFLQMKNLLMNETRGTLSDHFIKVKKQLYDWLQIQDNYVFIMGELHEDYNTIPINFAGFERLASQEFIFASDIVYLLMGITAPGQEQSLEYLDLLSYYFVWSYDAREKAYFETIQNTIYEETAEGTELVVPLSIVLGICLLITFLYLVFVLQRMSNIMKNAMKLLFMIDPMLTMSHDPILDLIQTGRCFEDKHTTFEESSRFTALTHTGIAVVSKNLDIVECNSHFRKIFPTVNNLHDLEVESNNKADMDYFVTKIMNTFIKCEEPRFMRQIQLNDKEGNDYHFEMECIAFCDTHAALEFDTNQVTQCVIIVKDITKFVHIQNSIEQHQKSISRMLSKVIPPQILEDIGEDNSYSFSTHSVTIGDIAFVSKEVLPIDKQMKMNAKMVTTLDFILQKYSTLSKVKSFMNKYTFCGGLFMAINKPSEHAEEAVRFCLEVLSKRKEIEKEIETEFDIKIGIHTGGPVIAGLMSLDHPVFQLLCSFGHYPALMRDSSDDNTIHVTRAVYELVFAFGFQISESQIVKSGNESIPGYTIVYE